MLTVLITDEKLVVREDSGSERSFDLCGTHTYDLVGRYCVISFVHCVGEETRYVKMRLPIETTVIVELDSLEDWK